MNQLKRILRAGTLSLFFVVLAACSLPGPSPAGGDGDQPVQSDTPAPAQPQPTPPEGEQITGEAVVDSIAINLLESFPLQVQVVARGNLPDGCTTIDQVNVQKEADGFQVTITTVRPADAVCTDALVPFEKVFSLDVSGLPKGTYSVNVNGVTDSFEFTVDNVMPQETPSEEPAEIHGVVWHDLCAVAGGEGGEPAAPSSGCVAIPDGGFRANGTLDVDEPGIEGVLVTLGAGSCPSVGVATTTTGADGAFAFTDLAPGTYCVAVDALDEQNNPILVPGEWTLPASGEANMTVDLAPGENLLNVNFGWDYQFLPEPGEGAQSCVDRGIFVKDVTVPDDSGFPPGKDFTKTWRLKNVGTCTWTKEYSLVFVEGDVMGGTSPLPLLDDVPPEGTVDLSVDLVAPEAPGTYRGDWKLRNAQGQVFGLGKDAKGTFFVQIVVVEQTSDLNLGAPDWVDSFNSAANWFLLDTPNTLFEVKDGNLIMTSINPGVGEEWGLANLPALKDFYIEATVKTGENCSGLDRYGLLVRAPDPNQGYVFGFSCDGRYRLYSWDGENYRAIQEWKQNSNILVGPDQTNKIGFWVKGSKIKLYANGKLLDVFTDSAFAKGRFGLFIGSAATENFNVSVDQVSYWKLED